MRFPKRHGHTSGGKKTPEFNSWTCMKSRCFNPKFPFYEDYGGRGITVCERWMVFENFFADMGPRPSLKHTLDRIDNNGHYEPDNCRWATKSEQNCNRKNAVVLEFRGERLNLEIWAKRVGIKVDTIAGRLKRGWPVDEALTVPPSLSNRRRAS